MTLYQLTGQYLLLQDMIDSGDYDEQTLADTLEGLDGEIEEKADGYAKIIRNIESDIAGIEKEIERLQTKKTQLKNAEKRLKSTLQEAMTATGKRKFNTQLFGFGICKAGGKQPIAWTTKDPEQFPDEMCRLVRTLDTEAVRKYLEDGGTMEQAAFAPRTEYLSIR